MDRDKIQAVAEDLHLLRRRLARGEIDGPTFDGLRERLLADLTPEERADLLTDSPSGETAAPRRSASPHVSGPVLGPSGGVYGGMQTSVRIVSDLDLRPGRVLFDRWRILRELGRGGFGAVFEVEDLHLHERQAVKILDPVMVGREELLDRFRREVSTMRRLAHPRIVKVFDYKEDLGQRLALFSMELVSGGNLQKMVAAAKALEVEVPFPLFLAIVIQILEALAEVHERGVIHADVAPSNVLLGGRSVEGVLANPLRDPGVRLVDFGIANVVDRVERNRRFEAVGTVAYLAPEVLDTASEVTAAADVYSAGVIAYELASGKAPTRRFMDPSQDLASHLDFADVILALMNVRPEARPTARNALAKLRRLAALHEEEHRKRIEEHRATSIDFEKQLDSLSSERERARRQQERRFRESVASGLVAETWLDKRTGLTWTTRDNGLPIPWELAKAYSCELTLGGFNDWRLPSIYELEDLFVGTLQVRKWTVPQGPLLLTGRAWWSADEKLDEPPLAWAFDSVLGAAGQNRSAARNMRVLCVRREGG